MLQFNTQEAQAKLFCSTCSDAPSVTQADELHLVQHPIWNPVIRTSQVVIIIPTAPRALYFIEKRRKIWLIAKKKNDIYSQEGQMRNQAVSYSLQKACDVMPAAPRPVGWRRSVQELRRHDKWPFPNRLAVITVAVMFNSEAAGQSW